MDKDELNRLWAAVSGKKVTGLKHAKSSNRYSEGIVLSFEDGTTVQIDNWVDTQYGELIDAGLSVSIAQAGDGYGDFA